MFAFLFSITLPTFAPFFGDYMESLVKQRVGLSAYFFISGLCFSSWASRIPSIQEQFNLNEAQLGSILFTMPISSLIGLPISGWLVQKFDSRLPLFWGFIFHCLFLITIGMSNTVFMFTIAIFLFALSNRITNISMNTQAINLQNIYPKKINGSFHGLWSLGGISGVAITTLMIALKISMELHFMIIAILVFVITLLTFPHLMKKDKVQNPGGVSLTKPDPRILNLGLLIFLAALCEGSMFDWSGIFFKDVVKVEIFTAGYLVFMGSMALSRFVSDRLIHVLGMKKVFILSSVLVFLGLVLAVTFPFFWTALIGFMIVGVGTAAVVPMVFTLAGNSKKYSPGIAISIIGTFGLAGFMVGPPLIGHIAHAFNLRFSFIFVAIMGLLILPSSIMFFKKQKNRDQMEEAPNIGEL